MIAKSVLTFRNKFSYYLKYAATDFPIKAAILFFHSMLFVKMDADGYGEFLVIFSYSSFLRIFFGLEIHRLYEIYGARNQFRQIFSDLIQSIFVFFIALNLLFIYTIDLLRPGGISDLYIIFNLGLSLAVRELALSALRANDDYSDYIHHELIFITPFLAVILYMILGFKPTLDIVVATFLISGFASIPFCYSKKVFVWKKLRFFHISKSLKLMVPYSFKGIGSQAYQGIDKILLSLFVADEIIGVLGIIQRLLSPIKVLGNSLWRSIRKRIIADLRIKKRVTNDDVGRSIKILIFFSTINIIIVNLFVFYFHELHYAEALTIIFYGIFYIVRFFSQKNDIQILVQGLNNRALIEPFIMLLSLGLIPLFAELMWWPAALACFGLLLSNKVALYGRHF